MGPGPFIWGCLGPIICLLSRRGAHYPGVVPIIPVWAFYGKFAGLPEVLRIECYGWTKYSDLHDGAIGIPHHDRHNRYNSQ